MEAFTKVENFSIVGDEVTSDFEMFATEPLIDHDEQLPSSPLEHIVLTFYCSVVLSNRILYEGISTEPEIMRETIMPLKLASVRVSDLHKQVSEFIAAELKEDCLLWDEAHLKAVDFTVKKAREAIEFAPPNHNKVLYLDIGIAVMHKHVYVGRLELMDRVLQHSMDLDEVRMVPAKDSSIESLEKKKVSTSESGTCSICLEEFLGSCEALSLPCSHFFHEDCIRKWLKTSHYCPICRFEMPTP